MTVSNFDLTVKSTSTDDEFLMVILNPSQIANTGKIYETYFPVAWNVLEFTANNGGEGDPMPGHVHWELDVTAVLQKDIINNIVQTGALQHVKENGDTYEVKKDKRGLPDLVKTDVAPNTFTATIFNSDDNPHNVGLGDKDGNSYLTMQVQPSDAIEFKYTPMFAVVPVGETVQGSKFVSGTVLKPWFSFSLDDVTDVAPSFTYDGKNLVNVNGVKITNHSAIEPVFGGSSKEL